jgi:ATP-dependent Clp protease ATP-binding subunit ClpC
MTDDIQKRLKEQGIEFFLTDEAKHKIASQSFDAQYGARPLRRALQRHIEDRLSEELLKGTIQKGDSVKIDLKDGEIVVEKIGTKV